MAGDLETVLADWGARAQTLRACFHEHDAQLLEEFASDVRGACEDYLTWLSEPDAALQAGKSVAWVRARFNGWAENNMARFNPRDRRARQYCALILPRRANIIAARADARRAAASESAA